MSVDDSTNNKPNPSGLYPQKVTTLSGQGAAGFSRVESWITPERLRHEFLFGIPLVSLLTGEAMTDDTIKSIIRRAAATAELKTKVDITPIQRFERIDFDRTKYLQGWNQLQLGWGNVQSLQEVSIRASNSQATTQNQLNVQDNSSNQIEGSLLYLVPLDWIDMSMAHKGLLHFVPLQTTFGSYGVVGPSAGAAAPLFAIFSQLQWIPAFWAVKYISGFQENSIPVPFNELIGCYAAMEILSLLGALIRHLSQSISIDGASQSTSTNPNLYLLRYQQLETRVADLLDLIAKRFGKKVFMSHI